MGRAVGIAAGLSESQAAIEQHIEGVVGGAAHLQSFLLMDPGQAGRIPASETGDYLEPIHRPHTQDDNLTFLRFALDDEVLKELDDGDFQAALVEWREAINQLDEIDRALSAHWLEALTALSRHEAVGRTLAGEAPSVEPHVMASVRNDPVVFSIAARKSVLMNLQLRFLPELADSEEKLLRAIEAQLSR